MLVLSRKAGQELVIAGGITVRVQSIHGNRTTLAIDAPPTTKIRRGELPAHPSEQPPEETADHGPN